MIYADIEDAVIARLAPLKDSLGVRIIASYGGQFSERDIYETVLVKPALLVQIPERQEVVKGPLDQANHVVVIYAVDVNARGPESARRGDPASGGPPGVYALLEGVRPLIHRWQCSGAGLFLLTREVILAHSQKAALCAARAEYSLVLRTGNRP